MDQGKMQQRSESDSPACKSIDRSNVIKELKQETASLDKTIEKSKSQQTKPNDEVRPLFYEVIKAHPIDIQVFKQSVDILSQIKELIDSEDQYLQFTNGFDAEQPQICLYFPQKSKISSIKLHGLEADEVAITLGICDSTTKDLIIFEQIVKQKCMYSDKKNKRKFSNFFKINRLPKGCEFVNYCKIQLTRIENQNYASAPGIVSIHVQGIPVEDSISDYQNSANKIPLDGGSPSISARTARLANRSKQNLEENQVKTALNNSLDDNKKKVKVDARKIGMDANIKQLKQGKEPIIESDVDESDETVHQFKSTQKASSPNDVTDNFDDELQQALKQSQLEAQNQSKNDEEFNQDEIQKALDASIIEQSYQPQNHNNNLQIKQQMNDMSIQNHEEIVDDNNSSVRIIEANTFENANLEQDRSTATFKRESYDNNNILNFDQNNYESPEKSGSSTKMYPQERNYEGGTESNLLINDNDKSSAFSNLEGPGISPKQPPPSSPVNGHIDNNQLNSQNFMEQSSTKLGWVNHDNLSRNDNEPSTSVNQLEENQIPSNLNQSVQDPDFIYHSEPEELKMQDVISRIAYYKHLIQKDITHGYHEESRATHDDGIHHIRFKQNRLELEKAVDEYLKIMSESQKQAFNQ